MLNALQGEAGRREKVEPLNIVSPFAASSEDMSEAAGKPQLRAVMERLQANLTAPVEFPVNPTPQHLL